MKFEVLTEAKLVLLVVDSHSFPYTHLKTIDTHISFCPRCCFLIKNVNCLCVLSGESCTDPVITPSAYTTSDAVIASETVFIVELSLTCANGAQVGDNGSPAAL